MPKSLKEHKAISEAAQVVVRLAAQFVALISTREQIVLDPAHQRIVQPPPCALKAWCASEGRLRQVLRGMVCSSSLQ